MYKQRILPLFLALALCTTQVSAEGPSKLLIFGSCVGMVFLTAYVYFLCKGAGILAGGLVDSFHTARNVYWELPKLQHAELGMKFNNDQLKVINVSQESIDLFAKLRAIKT